MKRGRHFAVGAVSILLSLQLLAAGGALAQRTDVSAGRTFSMTLMAEGHDVFVVDPGPRHSISLSLRVTSGGPVDVYVMPQSGYESYTSTAASEFTTFEALNGENISAYDQRVAPTDEVVYVVVDNANVSSKGANSTGPVNYIAAFTDSDSTINLVLGLVIVLGAAMGVVLWIVISRSRREASGLLTAPMDHCPTCGAPAAVGSPTCSRCGGQLKALAARPAGPSPPPDSK